MTADRRDAGAIDTRTPVLVLGAQHYGTLGIARSLGRLGVPVYAVDAEPRRAASYSRYLRGRFSCDLAELAPDAAVAYLLEVGRSLGTKAVLIPTSDATALLVASAAERLGERFRFPRQPDGLAASLADKTLMHDLARRHAVPTPRVTVPRDVEEVRAFAASSSFPVVLKGIDGDRLKARTGVKMVIVESARELVERYAALEDPAHPNLMLQEYIPGGDDAVWMFNGYFDAASDCRFGMTGRKIRQTPAYTGVTSLGVCLDNPTVDETTRRWMKTLGYRGILDIGYRFDARDGLYKVLDVNPRIGMTFRLFAGRDGLDVARALYLDLTGQPVPHDTPVPGRRWLVEGADVDSFLQYRRDGKLGVVGWLTSLVGVRETAYLAADDPGPLWRVTASFVGREARRALLGLVRRVRPWRRPARVEDGMEAEPRRQPVSATPSGSADERRRA